MDAQVLRARRAYFGLCRWRRPARLPAHVIPACEVRDVVSPLTDFFSDVSAQSGMQVGNFDPDPPEGMVINDHSRLAFADLNSDGFDDIVMHSLYPNPRAGVPFEHLVFLNNQDGTFSDHSVHPACAMSKRVSRLRGCRQRRRPRCLRGLDFPDS